MGKITPLPHILKIKKLERVEGPRQFLLVCNLILHVSGSLGVISMLKKEIMAVLSERGGECIGNSVQNTKI